MPSKEDVVKSTIECKITYFTEKESEILSGADDADLKIKSILQLYANTFGVIGNHIGTDLQIMYPKVWDIWQEFHRLTIHKVIELIKSSADEGFYRNLNLNVIYIVMDFRELTLVGENADIRSHVEIFWVGGALTLMTFYALLKYRLAKRLKPNETEK